MSIERELTVKIIFLVGNEHDCQLSLPARSFLEAAPVSTSLLFIIIALIRTAVALKQQVRV